MNLWSCKGHIFGMENTCLLDNIMDCRLDAKDCYFVMSLNNVKNWPVSKLNSLKLDKLIFVIHA
jgi:hypothetical protein